MPNPLINDRVDSWIEDPSQAFYSRKSEIVAAAGSESRLNAPFLGTQNFIDLIPTITNSSGQRVRDPNYGIGDISATNQLLETSSFLYYPTDLGRNKRYHHFVVFNIYQGTSDEIRLKQREIAIQETIVTNDKVAGGWGSQYDTATTDANGGASKSDSRDAIVRALTSAGFGLTQANQFADAWVNGATGTLILDGVTANETILFSDVLGQGAFQGIYEGELANIAKPGEAGVFDKTWAALKTPVKIVGGDLGKYFDSIFGASKRNNVEDSINQADDTRKTASGKKASKDKKDRVLLAANRRFNLANVKSKDTICLYMPLKLTFNDQLVYTEDEMGMAKSAFDALIGKRGASSALIERAGTNVLSSTIDSLLNTIGIESLNIAQVRAANERRVANPRREALFRDVGLRQHNFSFEFAPRNREEADMVLSIIKMFRYHAHPGLYGGGAHFLTFPAEFEATFYTIQENRIGDEGTGGSYLVETVVVNDNIPKLPRLALSGIQVDYSSAGDYKTFKDGKPAFIRLDLTFQEMEQLTNEHIINGY